MNVAGRVLSAHHLYDKLDLGVIYQRNRISGDHPGRNLKVPYFGRVPNGNAAYLEIKPGLSRNRFMFRNEPAYQRPANSPGTQQTYPNSGHDRRR